MQFESIIKTDDSGDVYQSYDRNRSGKWTREQNERLIELWKAYPVLYKPYDAIDNRKDKIKYFCHVAAGMQEIRPGANVDEIRARMKNIRAQYRREQRRVEQKLDVVLWCYDELRFLDEAIEAENRKAQKFNEMCKLKEARESINIKKVDRKIALQWTDQQIEKLIQLWKANPVLYEANHPQNNSIKLKEVYTRIASDMQKIRAGASEDEIKVRIKILKSQYKIAKENRRQGKFDENEQRYFKSLRFLDNEADEYNNQSTDFFDSFDGQDDSTPAHKYKDHSFGKTKEIDSNSQHFDDDFLNCGETTNPAKRFRRDENTCDDDSDLSSILDEFEPVSEDAIETESGNKMPRSLGAKVEQTLEKTNELLNRLSYIKESKHRAFVENLVLDLNKFPEISLRNIKWKISDIIYEAYQDQQRREKPPSDS